MAGVFKSLDKSDIRVVPFRAHKQWVNDLNYTLTSTPSQSVTFAGSYLKYLQTNYDQSVNVGNNYYYFVGEGGNIYQVDGGDNYTLLTQILNGPTIDIPFLSSTGANQDLIMYYNTYTAALCAHRASDLSDVDVDSYTVPSITYNHLAWIPVTNMVLMSGIESLPSVGLLSVTWDDGVGKYDTSTPFNTSASYNYLGTTAADGTTGDFFAAYVITGSLNNVYFEYKRADAVLYGTTPSAPGLGYSPSAVKDFVSNGNGAALSAFATMKGGVGLWLINGTPSAGQLSYQKHEFDVVRLLQDKDVYRNGNSVIARTFAVLRNGTILLDLYANSGGYGWQEEIDVRRWIGTGEVIAATINKNVDLISSEEPLKITIYAKTNQNINKAPIVVFSVNLDTQEVSDPIHLGVHITGIPSEPFLGDDGNTSVNFIGDNSAKKVVGLMYSSYIYDITTTNAYNKIYTFNI